MIPRTAPSDASFTLADLVAKGTDISFAAVPEYHRSQLGHLQCGGTGAAHEIVYVLRAFGVSEELSSQGQSLQVVPNPVWAASIEEVLGVDYI